MKILDIFKNIDLWKIGLMFAIVLLLLTIGGYTIRTKWGTISRENLADREMTKVKSQTNCAIDTKGAIVSDLCFQYAFTLRGYIKEKGYDISENRIKSDVKYYKLIAIAMSDACEDITIDRYIHNNDLYRYQNKNDWDVFKKNVVNIYMRKGTEIIESLYDDSKVILPLHEWHKRAGKEIYTILERNTEEMLEYLKIESCIYYIQSNGGSK